LPQYGRIADNQKLFRPDVALEHAAVDERELAQSLGHVVRHIQMQHIA
jgi:hypothetical protein